MREYTHRNLLEEDVRSGVGDIALGPVPEEWAGPLERLGFEELVVVLPASDPLAGARSTPLEALADRQWILFQPGHGLTEVVEGACRRAGFQPRVAVRTTQVEAATRLAAAGLGPAMVPDNVVSPDLDRTVVRLDPAGRPRAGGVHAQRVVAARERLPRGAEDGGLAAPRAVESPASRSARQRGDRCRSSRSRTSPSTR